MATVLRLRGEKPVGESGGGDLLPLLLLQLTPSSKQKSFTYKNEINFPPTLPFLEPTSGREGEERESPGHLCLYVIGLLDKE